MKPLIGLLIALAAGVTWAAETYKWVDERGIVTYGQKPPAGRPATPVDTTPSGSIDTSGSRQGQSEPEQRGRAEPPPPIAMVPPASTGAPVRGMEFDTFIRLQRGMTEGELLIRAGRPDYTTVDNFRNDIVKTYYYFPTVSNPFTTTVTVRGGLIDNLDRIKKF
ncbi:MAG TPA: DUF4124 domain-containing protein [Burkholderiales bacterium]|nr:DUF4124 domain-containing protein [Burkholderiales bacterium]